MIASLRVLTLGVVLALTAVVQPALAQTPGGDWLATRAELERRAAQMDSLAASTAYTEQTRRSAAAEAERVRRRLVQGDFRTGDRLYITIESVVTGLAPGGAVTQPELLQDTLTVLDGSRVNIRGVGEVSLGGVLRSELNGRLNAAISEVVLNVRVTSRPLVRLAVFGPVASPGYFTVPLETRLDGLIMLAGGPTEEADPDRVSVVRGDTVLLSAEEIRTAIAEGTVVGSLGLQEGDQLLLTPRPPPWDRAQTQQLIFFFLSPIVTFLLFRGRRF